MSGLFDASALPGDLPLSSPSVVTTDEYVGPSLFTANPPLRAGQYNPDTPLSGFYCTFSDVYNTIIGAPLNLLTRSMQSLVGTSYDGGMDIIALVQNELIPQEESIIDAELGQTFKPTQETRFLDGTGTNELMLPFYPIISIDQCRLFAAMPSLEWIHFQRVRYIQGIGLINPDTDYRDADLICDPTIGRLLIPSRVLYAENVMVPFWNYTFFNGQANVEVTMTYGYATPDAVPRNLRRATALRVGARILKMIGMIQAEGLAAYKSENVTRIYGRTRDLPYADLITDMEQQAAKILRKFKRGFV